MNFGKVNIEEANKAIPRVFTKALPHGEIKKLKGKEYLTFKVEDNDNIYVIVEKDGFICVWDKQDQERIPPFFNIESIKGYKA